MSGAGTALLLAFVATVVGALALRELWIDWEERRAVVHRSALSRVEARASTRRYRLDARIRRSRLGTRVANELNATGSSMPVTVGLVLAGGIPLVGFLLVDLVAPTWASLFGGYVGWRAVGAWLQRRRDRRRDEFVAQLPELARTISNAAAAGRSLPSAIRLAARELDEPAASELHVISEQLRIGESTERALAGLNERLPSREIGVMVTTLLIQQRAGGDLVHALREMSNTLEKRKDLKGEIRSLMAGAVYTSYAVLALGVGSVLFINMLSPGVVDQLLSGWLGRGVFLVAGILYAVGFTLMRRFQSIEV